MNNLFKVFRMHNLRLCVIALTVGIGFSVIACNKGSGNSSDPAAPAAGSAVSAPTTEPAAPAPAASSGTNLNKVDGLIADYEKFVIDYESVMKKLLAGDAAAIGDAERLGTEIEGWAEKWESVSGIEFTPAQVQKMEELNDRITSAFSF